MQKPRIAFLDDHSTFLEGIKQVTGKFNFFGEMDFYTSPTEFMDSLRHQLPDLVVLDLKIGEFDGISIIRDLRTNFKNLKIAVLTQFDSENKFKDAMFLDIQGYILKTEQAGFLPEIFLRILKGESYISKELLNYSIDSRPSFVLKGIEIEILNLMKAGKSMREIGNILNITPKVVEYRLKKIRKIYDAKNNPELIFKMGEVPGQ